MDLDQWQFAAKTGISRSIISQYESGAKTEYKWPVLVTWAYYSGMPLEWIVTGHLPDQPDDRTSPGLSAPMNSDRYPAKPPDTVPCEWVGEAADIDALADAVADALPDDADNLLGCA